jgi:hypothetical protein
LKKKYSEIANEINDYKLKIKIYQELKEQEDLSILKRQKDLEDKIQTLKDKEKDLQRKYKNLTELLFKHYPSNLVYKFIGENWKKFFIQNLPNE